MSDPHNNDIAPRVEKLEDSVDALEGRVEGVELQIGRITSHIESEIGLARKDVGRIEKRLFGEGDDEYGGRFGQMTRRIYKIEMAVLSLGGAAAIILFVLAVYEFFMKAAK